MKGSYLFKKTVVILLLMILLVTTLEACKKTNSIENAGSQSISDNNSLQVHFLAVGKADCILVQDSTGVNMLIDSGDDLDADTIYSYLMCYGVKTIDYLVLTHTHNDHIGAADMVIRNFAVKEVVVASKDNLEFYLDAYDAMLEKNVEIIEADLTKSYTLGKATFRFLGPLDLEDTNLNNLSIVTQLNYGESTFLLTGDIEEEVEDQLIETYGNELQSEVLKVPHHGSNTSGKEAFLEVVNPEYGIISVGNNNEDNNHPSKKTINRLSDEDILIYQTNEVGPVIAITDGTKLYVTPNLMEIERVQPPIPDENKVLEFFTQTQPSEDN